MKLSLCMIAKNAAADIRRPLESLWRQVDETVVIDTGSTDETEKIARAYGAKVYSFAWRDDFAAAKNFALEKAQGDWIVFLDADEWFAQRTGVHLRKVIERYSDANTLLVKMVNIDMDRNNAHLDAFYTARIFRRMPQIRYSGRIHEQICRTDGRMLQTRQVLETELILYHSGYSSSRLRAKAERNLRVLQAEMKKGANPAKFYAYLAECYAALDEEKEALHYARLDIALGRQSATYASRSYRVGIEALKSLGELSEPLEEILRQAMRDFPEVPDFSAEYALFCFNQKRYEEAKAYFQQALQLQERYCGLEPSIFYQSVELAKQILERAEKAAKRERERKDMKITKVSACVMVRDEEKNLPHWLMRVQHCVDEIIVVDTGSTDRTKQIALEAGAKVYDFAWRQDFAAVKNFAKAQATGEWILFLDIDEIFGLELTDTLLQELVAQARAVDSDAIVCTVVNIDADQGKREISRMTGLCLLRNVDTLHFVRPVYEKLVAVKGNLKFYMREDVEIFHTGYSMERIRKKQRRNLAILQQDREKNGEQPWHYRYFSELYLALDKYDSAIHYARMHLETKLRSAEADRVVYGVLADALILSHAPEQELQTILGEALRLFPQAAEFHARYGESYWRQAAFVQAKEHFLQARQAAATAGKEMVGIDKYSMLRDSVCMRLGEIALMQKEQGAVDYFKEALQFHKYNAEALRYLLLLLLQESEEAARLWLDATYVSNRRDLRFILEVLEQTQIGALYMQYTERYALLDSYAKEQAEMCCEFAAGEVETALQKALKMLPTRLQNYLIACFLTPQGEEDAEETVLADAFAALLRRYRGGAPLKTMDFSAYMLLLPEVLRYEGSDMTKRYVGMGLDFSGEELLLIAEKVFLSEAYELAEPLYARFAAQGGMMTPELQYAFGVALYAANEFAAAREHLLAARDYAEKRGEIDAYLTWIEEKLKNG